MGEVAAKGVTPEEKVPERKQAAKKATAN